MYVDLNLHNFLPGANSPNDQNGRIGTYSVDQALALGGDGHRGRNQHMTPAQKRMGDAPLLRGDAEEPSDGSPDEPPEESLDLVYTGIHHDSRAIRLGWLFVAMRGRHLDGMEFLAEVLAKGASGIVCNRDRRIEAETVLAELGYSNTGQHSDDTTRNIRIIDVEDERATYARLAARLCGPLPDHIYAVTGTNGKTSIVDLFRQLAAFSGRDAVSLGTLGPRVSRAGPADSAQGASITADVAAHSTSNSTNSLTTPDPVDLYGCLGSLKAQGVDWVGLEASSHGLDQQRLAGLSVAGAALTRITRDHLDYHGDMATYRRAKMSLFERLLRPGGRLVALADAPERTELEAIAQKRGLDLHLVAVHEDGEEPDEQNNITALETAGLSSPTMWTAWRRIVPTEDGLSQCVVIHGPRDGRSSTGNARQDSIKNLKEVVTTFGLVGKFQVENILMALVLLADDNWARLARRFPDLEGIPGRLEAVGGHPEGASVFVDYAHTPDALERVLQVVRQQVQGRVIVVFGAGGDRDHDKRSLMGSVAAKLADIAIITDDNPRHEDAASIRSQILSGVPVGSVGLGNAKVFEIGSRREAIQYALTRAGRQDVVVIAGKGHEKDQDVGSVLHPFDDREVAALFLTSLGSSTSISDSLGKSSSSSSGSGAGEAP